MTAEPLKNKIAKKMYVELKKAYFDIEDYKFFRFEEVKGAVEWLKELIRKEQEVPDATHRTPEFVSIEWMILKTTPALISLIRNSRFLR